MTRTVIDDIGCGLDVESLRLTHDNILIRVMEREKTLGGLYLPKNKNTELCVGEVLKVGPGFVSEKTGKRYPIGLTTGDIVFSMEYAGDRMVVRSGAYRFVRDHGIWARVKLHDSSSFDFSEVEPRFGNVLVEPIYETTTRSGLIHFANGQNKFSACMIAKVIRAGPGVWDPYTGCRVPPEVRDGDDVLMTRYAGAQVAMMGREYRIVNETDIRCRTEGL